MNEKILFESMNAIDDEILLRSEIAIIKQPSYIPRKRHLRLSAILIAATLAALLMGAGLVAILKGDNIQNWFAHYWEVITGQEMSAKQTALIDHLSQEIGLSQTIDGVIVTVDSATVGMDCFYLLIRVEGLKLSNRQFYGFRQMDMRVSPDPIEELGGIGSYGLRFHGIDGDGSAILLIDYDYVTKKGVVEDTRPLDITITLDDFCKDPLNDYRDVLIKGTWEFSFTLKRNEIPQQISLSDAYINLIDLDKKEQYTEVPILFTDILLTNTGLQFIYDYENGRFAFDHHVDIILTNGETIGVSGGSGVPLKENGLLFCSYKWVIPVDLEEVAAVRIGETVISVN
ncbi:MAG: hypothetical protein IKT45_01195 [Lachnospiraceae bacterium]|nr:hypothetical protein [Lachnospiraceae bacterium]